MNMLETIITLLADRFKVDKETITRETELVKDLGADSLELVRLLMILESDYGVYIDDDQVQGIRTVGDVADIAEAADGKDHHDNKRG